MPKSPLVALQARVPSPHPGKVSLDEPCPAISSWVAWKGGPQRSALVGVIEELWHLPMLCMLQSPAVTVPELCPGCCPQLQLTNLVLSSSTITIFYPFPDLLLPGC